MAAKREKLLIIEGDSASSEGLRELLASAGYDVSATPSAAEGFEAVRNVGVDVLLVDAALSDLDCCETLKEIKGSAATADTRVILLAAGGASERSRGLDLGADDVVSQPWEPGELLARVRAQLRVKRELDELREKTRIAEEGQQIAHNAFQALAVTEKMTRDAFSLGRMLRIGLAALLGVAAVVVVILFVSSRSAQKESNRAYAVIAQLERGAAKQEDLITQSRKMRQEIERSAGPAEQEARTAVPSGAGAKGAGEDSGEMVGLRKQLAENSARLQRIESERSAGQSVIRSYANSVCLLHVVVGFRDKNTGQRLRYAGINPQGEPLQDSEGNPIFSLTGRGPEVTASFFGTGFLAAEDGRILTNRHVAEPWWKNDDLEPVMQQGMAPLIIEINAYFPGSPRAYRLAIAKISQDADLAVMRGDLGDLKRPALVLDDSNGAAISGQPVVSMGYATGLAGILARAGEDTVKQIVEASNGTPNQVLAELARRNLIRPMITQGHIGDILKDKIVFDAQTTSGGSGGPLFNHHGKVIGVTFAVIRGFGGSNFGIPIHYAREMLAR